MVAVWLAPIYIMAERWGGEAFDCVPFLSAEPIRSVYGFETCARLWFYLFHYSFIGLLRPGNNQVVVLWQSRGGCGGGNTSSRSRPRLLPESNLFFGMRKPFHLQVWDLWKWHSYTKRRHTWAESHVCVDTYALHWQLATPLLDVYLNEIARNEKMTAIDKKRIFSLHFSYFICRPCTGCLTLHLLYMHWFCYLLLSFSFIYFFYFYFFIDPLQKKFGLKDQGIR